MTARLRAGSVLGACLAGLAMLAAASPTRASDAEFKGWFLALDAAGTQPNGLDQHYANEVTPSSGTVRRLVIKNDQHLSGRASIGYSFGRGLGSLQVSYWTFDHDDAQTAGGKGIYLYPTIFGSGYNNNIGLTTYPVRAMSKVKAKTYDLDYVRPLASSARLTVKWLAGLRHVTYEEEQALDVLDPYYTYTQDKHIESKGNGIRFGTTAVFGFSSHFAIEGGAVLSLLQAKVDAAANQNVRGIKDHLRGSNDYVRGQMIDVDVRAVWSYAHLEYYAGYGASSWDGLVADPLGGVGGSGSGPASTPGSRQRDSIAFDGARAGITFKFGRR